MHDVWREEFSFGDVRVVLSRRSFNKEKDVEKARGILEEDVGNVAVKESGFAINLAGRMSEVIGSRFFGV